MRFQDRLNYFSKFPHVARKERSATQAKAVEAKTELPNIFPFVNIDIRPDLPDKPASPLHERCCVVFIQVNTIDSDSEKFRYYISNVYLSNIDAYAAAMEILSTVTRDIAIDKHNFAWFYPKWVSAINNIYLATVNSVDAKDIKRFNSLPDIYQIERNEEIIVRQLETLSKIVQENRILVNSNLENSANIKAKVRQFSNEYDLIGDTVAGGIEWARQCAMNLADYKELRFEKLQAEKNNIWAGYKRIFNSEDQQIVDEYFGIK